MLPHAGRALLRQLPPALARIAAQQSHLAVVGRRSQAPAQRTLAASASDTRDDIGVGPGAAGLTVAEWSRKKNSDKGPAVSSRFAGRWREDEDLAAEIEVQQVPGVPLFMPAIVLRGIFTEEECQGLIAAVPSSGPGYLGRDEVYQLYNDRVVKYRYLTHDVGLAERLQRRLKGHIPEVLDGGRLLGVNPAFRFVHHDKGGHQAAHIDGREPVEPAYSEAAGGWVQSRLSLQIYLNGGFRGGDFAIVRPDPSSESGYTPKYVHTPRGGDAILFYQERLIPPSEEIYEVFHEARDVLEGDKFACRTMVDYVFPDLQTAKMANLKDDRPQ